MASCKKCTQHIKAYTATLFQGDLYYNGCLLLHVVKVILLVSFTTSFFKNWLRTSTKSVSILPDSGHINDVPQGERPVPLIMHSLGVFNALLPISTKVRLVLFPP